jgi:hypothetical protein
MIHFSLSVQSLKQRFILTAGGEDKGNLKRSGGCFDCRCIFPMSGYIQVAKGLPAAPFLGRSRQVS